MKNAKYCYLRIVLTTILISLTGSFIQAQTLGSLHLSADFNQENELVVEKGMALKRALEHVERQFNVAFLYRTDALEDKKVSSTVILPNNIKNALTKLLEGQELEFKYLNPKTYGIFAADKIPEKPEAASRDLIRGTVFDAETEETLPGVNVMVVGTTRGTATDGEGRFSMNVPSLRDTLRVSFVGYKTLEVPISGRTNMEILLVPEALIGEEVVVVGYGTQRKTNLTGSVDQISGDELAKRSQSSVGNLLQGTSPNLNVNMSSSGGEPGASPSLNIRGVGSIGGNDSPLILVDGVEMDLRDVNPNDIESISVLKDASASAIYGSRGAFGVVLITTKKGSQGEGLNLQYSNNMSFNSPISLFHLEDALIWATAFNQAAANAGQGPVYADEQMERIRGYKNGTFPYEYDPDNPISSLWNGRRDGNANYDWPDEFMKDYSFHQKHNISISGGSEEIQYYVSAGYNDENGLYNYGYDSYKRYNLLANLGSEVTDWLSFDLSTKFTQSKTDYPVGITTVDRHVYFVGMLNFSPMTPKYNINGTIQNPYIRNMQDAGRIKTEDNDLWLNLGAELEPIQGWVTRATYNYNLTGYRNTRNPRPVMVELGTGEFDNIGKPGTAHEVTFAQPTYTMFNVRTSYETDIESHYFKAMAGYEQEVEEYYNLFGRGGDLITPEVPSISTSLGQISVDDRKYHWATQGIFGRLNYNYDEKYLLEISGRYNGSSRFAEGSRWGLFPSAAVGYNISREAFWEDFEPYVHSLKLRASYGSLGNQQVSNYLHLSSVPVYNEAPWIIGAERPPYAVTPDLVSDFLTWETITTLNVGFDAGFLEDRLNVTFDWYQRETTDMLGPSETLPGMLGASTPRSNNAALRTRGYEIVVSWEDRISPEFSYNAKLNIGDNKSTILEYRNENGLIDTWYEGKQFGEIWGYKSAGLIQSADEQMPDQSAIYPGWGPGDMKYRDLDGDGAIREGARTLDDHGDLTVIGNSRPRYNVGLQAGFNWKNFNFSMLWQGVGKRDYHPEANTSLFWGLNPGWGNSGIYRDSRNLDYWRPADETNLLGPNTDAYFPKPYFSAESNKNRQTQSRYVLDGSYLRLKNIRLGYHIPPHLLKYIQAATIYVSGSNLITLDHLPDNMDPEAIIASEPRSGGHVMSGAIYPITKSVSVGVNITF